MYRCSFTVHSLIIFGTSMWYVVLNRHWWPIKAGWKWKKITFYIWQGLKVCFSHRWNTFIFLTYAHKCLQHAHFWHFMRDRFLCKYKKSENIFFFKFGVYYTQKKRLGLMDSTEKTKIKSKKAKKLTYFYDFTNFTKFQ